MRQAAAVDIKWQGERIRGISSELQKDKEGNCGGNDSEHTWREKESARKRRMKGRRYSHLYQEDRKSERKAEDRFMDVKG